MSMVPGFRRLLGNYLSSPCPRSTAFFSRGVTTKLFVGGLSFYTTEKALTEAFSRFGEVVEVKVVMDRVSQRSKGFGFVQYASEADAERAKAEMNGKVLSGRIIFVDTVKPKSQLSGDLPSATVPPVLSSKTVGRDDFEKL
jgi:cold-inducible RNA-binding protein